MSLPQAPHRRAIWRLLIVALGTVVVPLDAAVNIDFPAIVTRFDLPIPMIQWIVISYMLTQTSLLLTFGRIGDILGYRRIFLIGTGCSTLAFIACALAPNYPALIAARVVQGIGAGLVLSCGPALATSLFPEAMRTRVLARYMAIFGLGGALGPAVFGVLVQQFGWSAVFSFRIPLALCAFLLGWTLPRSPRAGTTEPFDATGGALLAVALSCLLLALNQLRHPGAQLALYALLAAAGFLVFYRWETSCTHPIIDFRFFHDADFTAINISNALINLAAFSIMLLAPFYLSRVPNLSLPAAGLVLAASPFGMFAAAPLAAKLATRISARRVALAGTALSSAGLFGISFASGPAELPLVALAMGLQGFGMGLFQVAYFDIVTGTIPLSHRGVAGALGMATRSIGTVTGATVLMLIFQTLRTADAPPDHDGFAEAFRATLRIAAAVPAALTLVAMLRQLRRQRSPAHVIASPIQAITRSGATKQSSEG